MARVERPWARRFPLAGDVGHGLRAGRLNQFPLLMTDGRRPVLLWFDEAGRPTGEEEWADRLDGFRPGAIFVREFASELADLSVYLFGTHEDVIHNPDVAGDEGADEEACASLDGYWMKGRNFVIQFAGTDYWTGPDGTIHPV
jgi:hypothetical protein